MPLEDDATIVTVPPAKLHVKFVEQFTVEGVPMPVPWFCHTTLLPPLEAAVTWPLAFSVILALVNDPTFEFTVGRVAAHVPAEVLISPVNAGNWAQPRMVESEAAEPLVFAALFGISPDSKAGNCA